MVIRFMQRSPGQPGRGMRVRSRFARSTFPLQRAQQKKLCAFLDEATMTRVLDGLGAIFGI